ncbi:MAG: hypothetical protein ACYDBS_06460, partial [Acidimicrobiales bacterium]
HGRVVAARLGAEGIVVHLRGVSEGPYPLQGAVEIFVSEEQWSTAREILLADAVDAAVDDDLIELEYHSSKPSLPGAGAPNISSELDVQIAEYEEELDRRPARDHLGAVITLALVVALLVAGIVAIGG